MEEERMTHDGRNHSEVRTQRGHWVRRWGATLTIVAVAVALTSCSSAQQVAHAKPTATTTAKPFSLAPNTTDEADPVLTLEAMGNPQWDSLVATYKSLQVPEYNRLPKEQRLKPVWNTYYQIAKEGYLIDFLDSKVIGNKSLADYNPVLMPVDKDTDGQTIVNESDFAAQVVMAMKLDITVSGNGPLDKKAAEQMLSGVTFRVGEANPDYKTLLSSINDGESAGKFKQSPADDRALDYTELIKGKDATGNPIEYKKVLLSTGTGRTYVNTYNLVDVTDGNGKIQHIYLLASQIRGTVLPKS